MASSSFFSRTAIRLQHRSRGISQLVSHRHDPLYSRCNSGAWVSRTSSVHGLRRGQECVASGTSSPGTEGGCCSRGERTRAQASVSRTSGGGPRPRESASWIDQYLPEGMRPYAHLARLDKPIGTWLFAWPCFWSIALAANPGEIPDLKLIALFGCASVLIRGFACTVNDYFDRDFDSKVERTKNRPLACGVVTPAQGLGFYALQILLTAGLLLPLNSYCQILGAFLVPLLSTYPLMKRITYWPQAYLGLAFNWGILVAWAAIKQSVDPAIIIPLYVGGIFWTLVYDTIYAHQDKEDDVNAGVKSTALMFGDSTKTWVTGFATASLGAFALSGYNAGLGWPYYLILIAAAGHYVWQIYTVDLSNGADCGGKFVSNQWFGALIFLGIMLGRLAI